LLRRRFALSLVTILRLLHLELIELLLTIALRALC
jgi:hypothetical protein